MHPGDQMNNIKSSSSQKKNLTQKFLTKNSSFLEKILIGKNSDDSKSS